MRCQPRATVASETGEGPTSETLELSREIDYHLLLLLLKKSVHQLSQLKNRISHHGRSNVPCRFPMPVMGSCFGLYGCGIRGMLEQLGRCGKSWFLACWERRDVRALFDSQSTPSTSPVAYSTVQYGRHVPSEIFLGSKNTWEGKKQTIGRNHGVYCSSFSPFSLLSFYINEYSWEHGSRGLALSTQELDTLVPL